MQVTWSAAAGQLQLNTRRVREETATLGAGQLQLNTHGVKEETPAPSTLFSTQQQQQHSNNELKAGLCLGQDEVSEMVFVQAVLNLALTV